ncbi:MAG TPA: UDP-N-acetylglucosamine 1-carboxyvinyltransferase [Firmicutes bacterium]|jgi:UDP-N-acetylglucosamine 1-carboxyvinyltransferase|nr:UDP-N-acetylglucosamine 1-carboxyvinyltransferase [Bacillota bacterium]HAW71707.1 UDP-N-acetylglucosamine 1-carboxyvinyltransferase [Bacillota bacterium]HAZ21198.1 UDP-N-acetylglucosamine 1-carboxyvinyltransferase [Bacillota bacterium]HBE06637.1 UDP-N-acetylglucosamine 1-carboxyvinyltransferase [Bacillota bacterium]HBL50492.1 UDP-N-acetylglucosamine 1-carboxyvinyltransferase [Bacillota bacterium]
MAKFVLTGGRFLEGSVTISGAKNSTLALMVASSLGKGDVFLTNVPLNSDVYTMADILRSIGVRVDISDEGVCINGADLNNYQPPYELIRKIRASFYTAGLLLARLGQAEVALPGGDEIGSRPVDFHMKGFQSLGADVAVEHGLMIAKSSGLKGSNFYINRASVGTTVNVILAAALAEGTTVLDNPAKEPEIVDTAILLNSMGAKIRGAGTDTIRIEGVESLHGCEHSVIPDRIEAGTFMIAAAAIGGDVLVKNVLSEHLRMPISKLREAGAEVTEGDSDIRVTTKSRCRSVDIETAVFPGFATDLQAPFAALLSQADGTGIIRETIFDNRFRYVDELRRMGADIKVERDTAIIRGVERLSGAPVEAADIRAGVSLVIAGLMSEGITEVSGVYHIDRGYENLEKKMTQLGASIKRVNDETDA